MLKDFKEFAVKGNVLDLAVGVVIGAAFGKIVTSFVSDLLMPPIGRVLGKVDFSNLFIDLSGAHHATLAEAKAAGKRIVTPPAPEEPRIINLMDALRQSLSETQKGRAHANGKSGDQRGKRPQRGRHATGKRKTG